MKEKSERHYRTVLGVPEDATQKQIRRAYLDCVKFYHPDNYELGSLAWENANKRLVEFNEAYAHLKSGPRKVPPQPPREQARERPGPPAGKKPPGAQRPKRKTPPMQAPPLTALLREQASIVFKETLSLLTSRASLAFGGALLCFLLVLSLLLYAVGLTTDRISARLAYAFETQQEQLFRANGTLHGWTWPDDKVPLVVQAPAPAGHKPGYYHLKFLEPSNRLGLTGYVHEGEIALFELPAGATFIILYAYGNTWYGESESFGPASRCYRMPGFYRTTKEGGRDEAGRILELRIYNDGSSTVMGSAGHIQRSIQVAWRDFKRY